MFKAALKSLLGRKLRLLMSTAAIVLGVGFVTGTLTFSDTLNRSFTAIFASTVGDVVVTPANSSTDSGPSTVTIPAKLVERLADVDGASRADGNVQALGVVVLDDNDKPIGGSGPPSLAGNWTEAPAGHDLEGLEITEGREPRGPNEVVLDESTYEKTGLDVGDQVGLVSSYAQAQLTPTIVGVAGFPDGGSLNGATLALFDTKTAQNLFLGGKNAFHDVWVTAEDGVSQEELRDNVEQALGDDYEATTGDDAADESASALLEGISFITTFLLIFAAIALIVGSFLIVNTFSILVAQRSRELALLRALGASKRQVRRMVLIEAAVVGFVGSSLGLGLGVLLFMGIRFAFGRFGLDLGSTPMVFAPRTVIAAYVVGMLVTMVAAWFPARRTSKIAPVAALRDDVAMPETSLRRRFLLGVALTALGAVLIWAALFGDVPRSGYVLGAGVFMVFLGVTAASPVLARPFLTGARRLFSGVFGTIGNLAGQNSLRNPRRTTATASALMIGLTLCATMAILGSSAKASVDETIEKNFVGDYVVSNIFGTAFSPSIAGEIEQVPGVEMVGRVRYGFVEYDGQMQGLSGVEPDKVTRGINLDMAEGSVKDLRTGTMLVDKDKAAEDGIKIGDTLEWQMPAGKQSYRVVGLFEPNPIVGFPYITTIQTLTDGGLRDTDNVLVIRADPSAKSGEAQAALERRLDEVVDPLKTVTVKDQEGLAEEQRAPIDQLLILIYGLLALALVIAVLGIVNTLALSVIERTREVGLLRAIGVSRRQLRTMIRLESITIAVLGAVIGTLLGTVFGFVLMKGLESEGLEVIDVPVWQLVVFVLVSLVVGVLAAVFPARRAARLDVLDAISTE